MIICEVTAALPSCRWSFPASRTEYCLHHAEQHWTAPDMIYCTGSTTNERRQQQLLAALPSCCRCSFSASCRREHCPLPDHSLAPAMIAPDPLMQITNAALPFCCWSLEWLRFCLFTVGFHGTRLFQPWIVFHVTVHTPGVPITNREVNSHFTVEVRIKSFQSI